MYLSPNSQREKYIKLISGVESAYARKEYLYLVISGDFNLPYINGKQEETGASESHTAFKEQKAKVLDLIFTKIENVISDLEYGAPIGSSHHVSL